ncbi:hypothetical protein ACHAWF_007613 [Thalassiosira exigua]
MRRTLTFLSLCSAASGFKSTGIQPSLSSGGVDGGFPGGAYRRPRQGSSRRSRVSVRQESPCVLRLAGEDDDAGFSSSSSSTAMADGVERRLSAVSVEKTEIVVASGDGDDQAPAAEAGRGKAATSTVNERLLSEIQASVEKEKYGSGGKGRDYFKDFRSEKTEEERQRSIEEARDLNGVNPLVCIGGAAFAWACAGALWFFTTYLGVLFASHPLETDAYFVERLAGVFRNMVMGLSSLASGFFGVVGIGIFLLGVRVAYGVVTGELDPTPVRTPKGEEVVLPDIWGLMMGKKPNRRGKGGLGGSGGRDDNPFGL